MSRDLRDGDQCFTFSCDDWDGTRKGPFCRTLEEAETRAERVDITSGCRLRHVIVEGRYVRNSGEPYMIPNEEGHG